MLKEKQEKEEGRTPPENGFCKQKLRDCSHVEMKEKTEKGVEGRIP
jgi:hypothetical protein